MNEENRLRNRILALKIENERLKEEIKETNWLIGAMLLSQGGKIKVYDKCVAELDKSIILTKLRDEPNLAIFLELNNELP